MLWISMFFKFTNVRDTYWNWQCGLRG